MRTTLKRGIGQSAGQNGNGHSALPPLFGPITRYRQPDPPHRSVVGRILRGFAWLVLAALVVATGAAGGIYLYGHESLNDVVAVGKVKAAENQITPLPSAHSPAIALIAGYDHRAGLGSKSLAGSNSDTLMLVRADPINHTLSLLSFPRDLYVPIYCRGDVVYTHDRINSAWSTCPGGNGPSATLDTMRHLTNLPINYLITLDFHAFKQLVNRLHGVYMNVDRRYFIPPHSGTSAINLLPGYQKLDGGQALSFVRFRHFDNDIYRTGRQQQFIEALKSRLRTSLSPSSLLTEVPGIMGALKGNLQVAKADGSAPDLKEIESYLGVAYHLPPGHLFRNQIPYSSFHFFVTPGGADVESASAGAVSAAVQSFLHPDVSESNRVSAQLVSAPKKPTTTKKTHPLSKAQISTVVLNAGKVPGEASQTSYLLARHGITVKSLPSTMPANAPTVQRDTTVYYDPVQPNAKQAAQQLRPLFGAHTKVTQLTPAIAFFAKEAGNPLTVVAVGTSFGGKLVVVHRVKLPPKAPPKLSPGASMTVPLLRGAGRRAHFTLMAPYRVAQYAQISTPLGRRVFSPLRGKHEVVLTFVQPDGIQHWQVEESDWTSPPILANPTGQFFFHGQKFLIYSTGGAVQMVALRTPKAVYWVTNTILNQLSNSTMIAIAKSLKPVR
jgi:LCP family protein required for cell wall assembly